MSEERPRAVRASTASYDVDGLLPAPDVSSIDPGTSLLISGPAMTGKTDLALDLIARGVDRDESALVVTPNAGAERVAAHVGPTERLHVVDCTGAGGSFDDSTTVKYVGSPGDLTGIGIGFTKCNQAIGDAAAGGVRIGVLSLSTILHYTDLDALFSFVHVLTGRIDAAGYLGVFTVETGAHDAREMETLRAQFDGVVELQEVADGTLEGRVLGLGSGSREWMAV